MLLKKTLPLLFLFPLLFQGCTNQKVIYDESHPSNGLKPVALKKVEGLKSNTPTVKPVAERPLSAAVLYHLLSGEIAGQRGQFTQAVAQYMQALKLEPDPKVAERAARIAVFAHDDRSALEAAQIWVKLEPSNLEAQQVTAALLVRTGQTDAALAHVEKILSLTGKTKKTESKGFMLIVALLSKEQDKQAAMAVMDKLVASRQQNPAALYAYSHLALLVGELDKAATNIDKALALKPDWIDAHLLQANILIRQGRNAEALKKLAAATAAYPDEIKLRLYYARKLIDEKKYEQAREQFQEVLERQPEHVDALYAMGLLGLQLRKLDQAQASFEKLLKIGKRVSATNFYLGELYEIKKQPQQAIKYYRGVTKNPQHIEAQIRIAGLLAGMGKLDAARSQLHRIQAPTLEVQLRLYLAEGELLQAAGQPGEAFEVYTQALEHMPANARLLYARALVAEKIKRLDIAIQDLQLILKNEPDNIEALNALGYTLVDKTDRLQEGMNYISKALTRKPDDPAIMDSAGWAYYRLGKYKQALELLHRAYAKMPDPEIASHLGEVLWVSGNQAAARKIWDAALQQTPKHELLRNVMRRFME
ncbi:FIG140336: TPR domain protein [hydrothermal vent metagenome]|uniref:FIG140336: TPR domain protein n=1 Tax=hydrothermal vent metagenome TaxID=652676 RepID=A0A3B1BS55_9ZZZZ